MSYPQQSMSLGNLPSATGGYYSSPRQAGMGFGGYTGLSPQDELYAQQFGRDAQNGNFWRGAALWTVGAGLAGTGTVAMERQWLKETHGSYTDAKKWYLNENLTDAHKTTLGIAAGSEIDLKAVEGNFRKGFVQNLPQLDKNPYKGVNKILSDDTFVEIMKKIAKAVLIEK
jgi:hypothetical protein